MLFDWYKEEFFYVNENRLIKRYKITAIG